MTKKKILLFFALPAFLAVAGAGIVIWLSLRPAPSPSLPGLLTKADEFLNRSYVTEAAAAIDRAFGAASSPEDFLRVLKRSHSLSRSIKNFQGLKIRSLEAFGRFPASAELCRLALYACLRDGDITRAVSLKHQFRSLPEVQALQAEVLLKNATVPSDLPVYARYAALDTETDPDRLVTAGRELGDDRFYLDAALLYLAGGKVKEAAQLSRTTLLKNDFDEAAGLIFYEAAAYDHAVNRLQGAASAQPDRPDLYLIMGDCYLLSSQPERAAGCYEQSLQMDRAYSFVPYINLAWVSGKQGFEEKALYHLRQAAALFPDNETVVFEYAKLLTHRGNSPEAARVLSEFLKLKPDNFNARYLKLQFDSSRLPPEDFLLKLKEFYFENPKSEQAAERLVSALLDNRDLSGAQAILTHYAEVNGSTREAWLENARGILASAQGDLATAAARFGTAIALQDRWEERCNRAAVLVEMGKLKEAQDDLQQALSALESRTDENTVPGKALVHARLAVVYEKMDRSAEADREVRAALSLDPQNTEAYRVRKKLEGRQRQ
jgi:tetratricopeptide (TPR) repeat protein